MNLAPLSDLVKPDRATFAVALAGALLMLLSGALILRSATDDPQRVDHYGRAVAGALASLAADPMSRSDRLHLAVLGNRLVDTPEIRGVASYSPRGQLLATTGDLNPPHYDAQVAVGDSAVGRVRVALEPASFAARDAAQIWALLGAALLGALLVAVAATLVRAGRDGRLAVVLPQRRPPRDQGDPAPAAAAAETPDDELTHHLLAVNFYNQLTLAADQREFELSLCGELAEAVADLYGGQVVSLPGIGLLVDFDHADDPDRPFQVICAALVLARLLHEETEFGSYRLGLNLASCPSREALALDDESVADAALLSALGKDQSLAISAAFAAALDGAAEGLSQLDARPLRNPLLDQLTTSDAGCYLVFGLATESSGLIEQQVDRLRTQRDATSSPSTF